jgi:lysophospholipase L1-like esterase
LVTGFDPDHDGHPGWRADEIVAGRTGSGEGTLSDWLMAEAPHIVLLHIGTNDVSAGNENASEVEDILTVIDDYEFTSGKNVWVILALIVNRGCDPYIPLCPKSQETTDFNDAVRNSVFLPRQTGGDNILLVDMENGAGINYERWDMGGDMWDDIHPFETGYAKMADLWYTRLLEILPQADAGSDQDVNEFDIVTLDASGSSDPKNGTLTYQWVQTAGAPVVLSDDTAVQPTFDAPGAGALTFTLTVTDGDELVSTDTVEINVGLFAEIIGTWDNGIWYWDVAESRWTKMTSSVTDGDIAAGDFTGDGRADVASSWGNGLWYQDGVTLDWTKVSSSAADRLTAGDVTGD